MTSIQEVNQQFINATSKADTQAMAAVYTEKGQVLPPGSETVTGKENIGKFWAATIEAFKLKSVDLKTLELEEHGDTAIETGLASLYGENQTLIAEASYIVIWKKENGNWRWHKDIFNMNA